MRNTHCKGVFIMRQAIASIKIPSFQLTENSTDYSRDSKIVRGDFDEK